MPAPQDETPAAEDNATRRARASRRAADALLREHPDAILFASRTDGEIVPVPESLGIEGYEILTESARSGIDLCVAEDRMAIV